MHKYYLYQGVSWLGIFINPNEPPLFKVGLVRKLLNGLATPLPVRDVLWELLQKHTQGKGEKRKKGEKGEKGGSGCSSSPSLPKG